MLINNDIKLIHFIPLFFSVDEGMPVKNPLNLVGNILEMQSMIIVSQYQKGLERLISVCEMAGINATYFLLSQISSAIATTTAEERDRGVLLVDIGGGKTEIGIFKNGILKFYSYLPIGGNHFTNDLSIGLGLPFNECERIKKIYSEVYTNYVKDEHIEVISYDGTVKNVVSGDIFSIINPRAEELLLLIKKEIRKSGFDESLHCAILTGGVANMSGLSSLAEEAFEMPVRIGSVSILSDESQEVLTDIPNLLSELSKPEFACVVGTAIYGLQLMQDAEYIEKESRFQWLKNLFN